MPIWNHTLQLADIFHDDDLTLEQKRDEIVRRIKASPFWDEDDTTLTDVVHLLELTDCVEEFDAVWDEFYDWADAARVWVATF